MDHFKVDPSQFSERGPLQISRDYSGHNSDYNMPPIYIAPQPVYHAPAPAPVYHAPAPMYHPAPAPTYISVPSHPVQPYKPDLDLTPILFSILPLFLIAGSLLGYAFSSKSSRRDF